MYSIPSSRFKRYPRPLQGGARVVSGGRYGGGGLVSEYRNAMNKANRANEARYQAILQGYDDLRGRVLGDLEGAGATERADIEREFKNASSKAQGYLINRGFGNSSLAMPMQASIMRAKHQSLGGLNERVRRERAGYDVDLTDRKLGVMERRYDNGPDYNQMIALAQGLGRAGIGPAGGSLGQPIGIPPAMYAGAYNNAMMQHLGMAGAFSPRPPIPTPRRNYVTQALRHRKYTGRVPEHLKQYLP